MRLFAKELESFHASWQLACHSCEIPKIGCLRRMWFGGELEISRSSPAEIEVRFYSAEAKARTLNIRNVLGFIFVCDEPSGPAIDSALAPFLPQMRAHGCERVLPLGDGAEESFVQASWKSLVEISLDESHVELVHPEFAGMMGGASGYRVHMTVRRWHQPFGNSPTKSFTGRLYLKLARSLPQTEEFLRQWTYYWIFPGLELEFYPEQMVYYQIVPLGPRHCLKRARRLGVKTADPRLVAMRWLNTRIQSRIDQQDIACVEKRQTVLDSIEEIQTFAMPEDGLVRRFQRWVVESVSSNE